MSNGDATRLIAGTPQHEAEAEAALADTIEQDAQAESLELALIAELAAAPDWRTALELAKAGVQVGELISDVRARPEGAEAWLIPGLIRQGGVTLLAGREKTGGKSTLMAFLLGALERDDPTLFGEPAGRSIRTVWVTEEPEYSLREKGDQFGLRDTLVLPIHHWGAVAAMSTFAQRLELIELLAKAGGYEHVVIDPLSRIAEVDDEAGTELGKRAGEASAMAQRSGLAVTILHHANKADGRRPEDAVRGSTSLAAACEQVVVLQVKWPAKSPRDRMLTSFGRVRSQVWRKRIRLDDDGEGYTKVSTDAELPDDVEESGPTPLDALREVGPGSGIIAVIHAMGKSNTQSARKLVAARLAGLDGALVTIEKRPGLATLYTAR
jgi:hypothetical protein